MTTNKSTKTNYSILLLLLVSILGNIVLLLTSTPKSILTREGNLEIKKIGNNYDSSVDIIDFTEDVLLITKSYYAKKIKRINVFVDKENIPPYLEGYYGEFNPITKTININVDNLMTNFGDRWGYEFFNTFCHEMMHSLITDKSESSHSVIYDLSMNFACFNKNRMDDVLLKHDLALG